MHLNDIPGHRLASQKMEGEKMKSAKDIVGWMGAMQAQDYAMAKWAIGIRVPGTTDARIEKAVGDGEIIRTHVMRPTWHFVSPDDVSWMLDLTAPGIKKSIASRHRELELSEAIFKRS